MNILGFQLLTYLVQLGTVYTLACVWKSNVTFLRGESQKIDCVLEIYHLCFFFNKVQESGFFFNVFCICIISLLPILL